MNTYRATITITLRKGILDVQGKTVEHALHSINFASIRNVRIGRFVELTVQAGSDQEALDIVNDASRKLIANPIMEDFHVQISLADNHVHTTEAPVEATA
ncbi:MAG TPA: phosphoribosylformylglycinamidine synthase subunit PurS [Patescibacteria group bacterium]|nr:phosphoribosylformylglycinamidine synthase subunit PurS [Patescibacteria group bacterium]